MFNLSSLNLQTAGWLRLPDWLSFPLGKSSTATAATTQAEIQSRHLAFHRAYAHFARIHPQCVQRGFDDRFLRRLASSKTLPTGYQLAADWDRQYGLLYSQVLRCQQMAELGSAADCFLSSYHQELLSQRDT